MKLKEIIVWRNIKFAILAVIVFTGLLMVPVAFTFGILGLSYLMSFLFNYPFGNFSLIDIFAGSLLGSSFMFILILHLASTGKLTFTKKSEEEKK